MSSVGGVNLCMLSGVTTARRVTLQQQPLPAAVLAYRYHRLRRLINSEASLSQVHPDMTPRQPRRLQASKRLAYATEKYSS